MPDAPITLDFVPTDIRIHFGNGRPASCVIERRDGGSGTVVDFVACDIPNNAAILHIDPNGERWLVASGRSAASPDSRACGRIEHFRLLHYSIADPR